MQTRCPWRNPWRGISQTSRRSITPVGVDIIYRPGASAGRTARHATNGSGVVAEIGKHVENGGNAKQDGSGASAEHGSANVSGAEVMITGNAGNVDRPGPPHSGPFQLKTTKNARRSRSRPCDAKQSTLLYAYALYAQGRHRGTKCELIFQEYSGSSPSRAFWQPARRRIDHCVIPATATLPTIAPRMGVCAGAALR